MISPAPAPAPANSGVPPFVLVCFAVEPEAAPFRSRAPANTDLLVTGMGAANAVNAVRNALASRVPQLVVTTGFAGGLDPRWPRATVVFDAESTGLAAPFSDRLRAAGAVPGRIHCADRVATTVSEKRQLRAATGADAVEMESGAIRALCRERGIPAVTVRVISDQADEDLPLDFNALMTPDHRLHAGRFALRLLRSPGTIAGLLRLQRHCRAAAERLAAVLLAALPANS